MAESTILPSSSSRDRLYQSSRRHPRTYSQSFFQKTIFQTIFGSFPRAPVAQDPHLRIPLLAPRTLGFFPTSPHDSRFAEAVDTYLQRHPYTKHFHVTSASSSTSHRLRPSPFTYFFKKQVIKKFFGPFSTASGAQDPHFRIPLLALRTLGFFPPLYLKLSQRRSGGA